MAEMQPFLRRFRFNWASDLLVQQSFDNARTTAKNKNKEGSYQFRRRLTVTSKGAREAQEKGIAFVPTGGKRACKSILTFPNIF